MESNGQNWSLPSNAYPSSNVMRNRFATSAPSMNTPSQNKIGSNRQFLAARSAPVSSRSLKYTRRNHYSSVALNGSMNNIWTDVASPRRGYPSDNRIRSTINLNARELPPAVNMNVFGTNLGNNSFTNDVGPPTISLFDTLNEDLYPQPLEAIRFSGVKQVGNNSLHAPTTSRLDGVYYGNIFRDNPTREGFWITVFGFPPNAQNFYLEHFANIGNIIERELPPQNSNWMHIKYLSRLECERALCFNRRIFGNSMIGVKYREVNQSNALSVSRAQSLVEIYEPRRNRFNKSYPQPSAISRMRQVRNTEIFKKKSLRSQSNKMPWLLRRAIDWLFHI